MIRVYKGKGQSISETLETVVKMCFLIFMFFSVTFQRVPAVSYELTAITGMREALDMFRLNVLHHLKDI